jgi:cytochrome c oxidase subunit II
MKKLYTLFFIFTSFSVHAAQPKDWQLGFQPAVTSIMQDITWMHNYILLPVIIGISVFVLFLMLYLMVKFRESKNPTPSKSTHNVMLEVLWTVIPCLILVVIAVPSFKLLYKEETIPKADVTLKAIGYQWYWGYEYPDEKIAFESVMIEDKDLKPGQPRLLATDTKIVVPVNKVVKVLITSADVNHAWAMPAFGVKRDAIKGRINETWFKAEKEGVYYGQCSELCGIKHAFMPIELHVVSEDKYASWLVEAKKKYAMEGDNNSRIVKKNKIKEKM